MTLTKMQAMLGVATVILTIASVIGGAVTRLEGRFAALDTRLAKLESAIKALNAVTSDENYKALIKELMAQETSRRSPLTGQPVQRFGGNSLPADAGASASSPAMVKPQ